MQKNQNLLQSTLYKVNESIAGSSSTPIDITIVEAVVRHQDKCIVDGMMRLEKTIKIDKLGKFKLDDRKKKRFVTKYCDGDESKLEERKSKGLFHDL